MRKAVELAGKKFKKGELLIVQFPQCGERASIIDRRSGNCLGLSGRIQYCSQDPINKNVIYFADFDLKNGDHLKYIFSYCGRRNALAVTVLYQCPLMEAPELFRQREYLILRR